VQEQEFIEIYGERMGQRLLPSCLLLAYNNNDSDDDTIVGMATLEVTLMATQREGDKFLKYTDAEDFFQAENCCLTTSATQRIFFFEK